jgi:ubiquinone/menaquinone biosynthesis C-methylase UbiE
VMQRNIDDAVVRGFGAEWARFDQSALSEKEFEEFFYAYFHIFPWADLGPSAEGFDLGCGSGRWAREVAKRVGRLHCIDASEDALNVARRNLVGMPNVRFHHASVDEIPLVPSSMDFGYSLGVLHHVPDTEAGLAHAVSMLKPGAPFLLYLYYSFDNQPAWYRAVWRVSNTVRLAISRAPTPIRHFMSDAIAAVVYFPLARSANVFEKLGLSVHSFPLAPYRARSFYSMRTDALDRFGTRLEKRFSRLEIHALMERTGLRNVTFSETSPFWCAVGWREGLSDSP